MHIILAGQLVQPCQQHAVLACSCTDIHKLELADCLLLLLIAKTQRCSQDPQCKSPFLSWPNKVELQDEEDSDDDMEA